jgi:hypothetical protein
MEDTNLLNEALALDTEIGKQIGKIHSRIIAYRNGLLEHNPTKFEIYAWHDELTILVEKRIENYKLLIKLYTSVVKYRKRKGFSNRPISYKPNPDHRTNR